MIVNMYGSIKKDPWLTVDITVGDISIETRVDNEELPVLKECLFRCLDSIERQLGE